LQTDVRAAFLGAKLNPMLAVALDDLVADEPALLDKLWALPVPEHPTTPTVTAILAPLDA